MRLFARLSTSLILFGVMLLQLYGCHSAPDVQSQADQSAAARLTLYGAGSTFAAPIFQKWMEVYGAKHPELRFSYASVGSGEGIDRFRANTVDVGATDEPLSTADGAGIAGRVHQIPVTAGMIGLTYNLTGIESPINLPRDVYVDIFLAKIYRWDDPRIAAANPGIALPHKLIQVVARVDSSGTTFAFTNHLAAISEDWAKGPGIGKLIDWPAGAMVARGNEGVAQRVKITEGAIGYVESGFADRLHLPLAWVENRTGGFVQPVLESGQRALADGSDTIPEDLAMINTDPNGARSYPIVTYTWLLLRGRYEDPTKQAALKKMVRWALTEGQRYAEPLHYVPLPDNVVQAALNELDTIGG